MDCQREEMEYAKDKLNLFYTSPLYQAQTQLKKERLDEMRCWDLSV